VPSRPYQYDSEVSYLDVAPMLLHPVLKQVAAEYLPDELLYPEKLGFPAPITPWFQSSEAQRRFREVLLDPRTVSRGIFKQDVLGDHIRLVARSERGAGSDATYLIWNLVNLELWQRIFTDMQPASVRPLSRRAHAADRASDEPQQRVAARN